VLIMAQKDLDRWVALRMHRFAALKTYLFSQSLQLLL
jgi:hypothetical protein